MPQSLKVPNNPPPDRGAETGSFTGALGAAVDWFVLLGVGSVVVARLVTTTEGALGGQTLWIAQLAFLVLLLWVCGRVLRGSLDVRWSAADWGTLLLTAGHVIGAGIVFWRGGDRRAALNLLMEWLGVGATAFLISRQLDPRPGEEVHPLSPETSPLQDSSSAFRSLVIALVATATGLAALGIYQRHFGLSEQVETFRQLEAARSRLQRSPRPNDPRWVSEWMEIQEIYASSNIPMDPVGRKTFEMRLLSTEPMALFALANTFAGVLAPGLILLAGWLWTNWDQRRTGAWLMAGMAAGVVAYCLLLTKSRTAWVGAAVGLAILAWSMFQGMTTGAPGSAARARLGWLGLRVGLPLAAILGLLVVVATWSGSLDLLVLLESGKSLRYRLEWWSSTLLMQLASAPRILFGVGLGNFRQNYLPYKLIHSSEEVLDPHNLILDAWANGGLLAVAGLVVLGLAVVRGMRQSNQRPGDLPRTTGQTDPGGLWQQPALGMVICGCGVALWKNVDERVLGIGLVAAVVTAFVVRLRMDRLAVGAAFWALFVHLLGAGGMELPALSQLVIGLACLGSAGVVFRRQTEGETRVVDRTRPLDFGLVFALAAAMFGGGLLNLAAVRGAEGEVERGKEALKRRDASAADSAFSRAAVTDPFWIEPVRLRARLAFELSGAIQDEKESALTFARAVDLQQNVIQLDPQQHASYQELGQMYQRRFQRTRDPEEARQAVAWMKEATARYRHRAAMQVELMDAAIDAGDWTTATQAAKDALRIHEANVKAGHPDKQLPKVQVDRVQNVAAGKVGSS